jgi:hypothetical protein
MAAWFLLALSRNIKRDPSIYEIFRPVQAFALALYLNFLVLGFLLGDHAARGSGRPDPIPVEIHPSPRARPRAPSWPSAWEFSSWADSLRNRDAPAASCEFGGSRPIGCRDLACAYLVLERFQGGDP